MINISCKQRNNAAVNKMSIAMTEALYTLKYSCGVYDYPGYDRQCDHCPAKQGCRDISRAAVYINAEFFKRGEQNV